jgi:hypothetical protein
MPILMLALMALAVFLGVGLLLFSATFAERRQRIHEQSPGGEEKSQARGANA